VIRVPVYPKINYNAGYQLVRPCPTRLAAARVASCTPTTPDDRSDYVSKFSSRGRLRHQQEPVRHHRLPSDRQRHHRYFAADATNLLDRRRPEIASYNNVILRTLFNEPRQLRIVGHSQARVQGGSRPSAREPPTTSFIVPSMSYDQHPGDAASNPPGTNLVYTATSILAIGARPSSHRSPQRGKGAGGFSRSGVRAQRQRHSNLSTLHTTWGTISRRRLTTTARAGQRGPPTTRGHQYVLGQPLTHSPPLAPW